MKINLYLALAAIAATLAGCGPKPQEPLPSAPGAPPTVRDAKVKNDPNIPENIRSQIGGGAQSGPRR